MEEYINDAGDLYTVEEINQAAEENNTTFEDIIKRNKLSLKKQKAKATEEITPDVPGKPKPVVKKDAVATAKSTASKSAKPSSVSSSNPFGEVKSFDPLGLEKFKKTPAPKPTKAVATAGQGYKYDSRGYLVPKDTKEPSLWDDFKDFAKNLFPDSEEDNNGKLTYYEQTPIKDQQALFNKDSKDAMNATGKFEFLKDYKPEDRALFVSKLVPKTNYTEKRYNSDTDSYEIAPKQEAVDYIMKDIDPSKFKTKTQLANAIALNTKKLASQDKAFEFEQQYAKAKATPLINSKIEEIKKKYSLTTPESVAKATKELQDYAAKITTDFLINSDGFQRLNQSFASVENQATLALTKQYERSKEGMLSFYDTGEKIGKALEKQGGLVGVGGKVIQGVGRLAEGTQEGFINVGNAVEQSLLSANQGQIADLNNLYSNIKDKPDNAPLDKSFGYEWQNKELNTYDPKEQDVPKTYGEAKTRLKKYLNKTTSIINDRVETIANTRDYTDLFNKADLKDGIQLNDVFTLVGQQAPNLALTGAAAATGNPLLVGLSATNIFTQEYGSQYYDTIETGLREDLGRNPTNKEIAEAIGEGKYANRAEAAAGAAVSASLEYVSQLNILKNTGRALGLGGDAKTVLGSLFRGEIKNFSKSILQRSTGIAKSGLGEYLTESAQQAISQSVKGLQLQGDTSKYIDLREINEAGKAGGIVGAVFPFAGSIKTQTGIELRATATKVATMFDLSNANMSNLVQVNNFFNEAAKNVEERFKVGDITKEQKQIELETLGTIRSSGVKIPSEFNSKAKEEALNLMLEKANIEKAIDGKDKDLVTPELERLKTISSELATIAVSERERLKIEAEEASLEKDITTDVERAKIATKALGLGEEIDMPELNTANDVITYLSENTELDENTIEDIADSYGAFIPLANGKEALIINKEAAAMDQVVTTGQHEFLHKLIYKAVKDNTELQKKIGTDLYNHIENYIGTEEFNNTEFKNRYDIYKTDFENTKLELENKIAKAKSYFDNGTISQERYNQALSDAESSIFKAEGKYLEETLPLLSESLTKGDIKYNETFFTKIGDILRRIFQKYGLSKVKFNTGKDVFDFVRDYNKSFEKGQFTKAFKALAKEGTYKGSVAKGNAPVRTAIKTGIKKSQGLSQVETLKNQLKEIQDNEFDYDPDDFDQQVANLQSKIKKAIEKEETTPIIETKKEVSEEDTVKEIIKSERGSVSSDRVQQIYNDKGLNGAAEIIKLFRPITNKIVDKRRDAPGFDKELLTDEIETGVGGILDLIKKYNPESGIPLAAYINKYLPVRAIATSRRILDQQFKKDVTEEKGLMAEETVVETKEKPKYKNVLESKVFEPETLQAINDKILTVVRTLKSKIDEPISLNRTVTPIIAEIRDEMGKLVDIDVKTAMGGKKDNQLKNWLLKNKRYVLENMTTTWLMGKDGQGGMPIAIQKQIDGRWTNYPEWVGQKIDRETTSTDNAGRTSGAELVRRLPNVVNNISDADYLAQILGPDGNPLRGRKESLAKAIAEEASFDIINDDLAKEGVIYDALEANQKRLGVEQLNNIAVEVSKQIERGNVKFSRKLIKGFEISKEKLGKDILNAKTIEDEVDVINNWIASDGRSLRTLAWEVGKGLKQFTTNRGLFENIILPVIKTYSKFEGIIGADSYRIGTAQKGESIYFGETKVPLWADTTIIKNNWKNSVDTINTEAIKATNNLINVVKYFKDSDYTKDDFESYLALLRWDQRSLIRKVSKAGLAVLDMKKYQRAHLEHNVPVQNIVDKTIEFFDGKITEKELRDFIGNAQVNLVPDEINKYLPDYKEGENRMYAPEVVLYLQSLIDNGQTILNLESEYGSKQKFKALVKLAKSGVNSKESLQTIYNNDAVTKSLVSFSKPAKGISVFDFDDTIGLTKSNVLYTMPDGTKGKLNGAEFAKEGARLLGEGAQFDFSEFSKVVDGKPGPMVEKMKKMIAKFGPDNFFILTARPANSAQPIHQFLDSIDINIPLENITGLGNSTAQAKADWMTAKASEGYNDFYFADDHLPNVNAVKDALNVLDVKSKIQQARIKFSKTISPEFNKIIEENTGMENYKVFSDIVARRRGINKNKFDLYVPPSAADFELLLYNFIGKGNRGEEQKQFFSDALLKPYANGNDLMDAARQSIKNDYKALTDQFPDIKKKIEKLTPDGDYTYDQAIRVAMWTEEGVEIPGISQRDQRKLTDLVNNDPELTAFKQGLIVTGRQGRGWVTPTEYWDASTIISDLHNLTEGEGRKKFLAEFIDNAQEMFGKWENGKLAGPNINKVEAVYGTNVREAIEDVLWRMTTGKNRSQGKDKETSAWSNWVNGSTGTIMFLNTRSAALQLIGAVNFLNLRDNNPIAAGKAFANQKQYWEDFARIWNSDKMKERRGGLKEDVAAAEIANAAAGSKNKVNAVISYLLKIGYTPTQLADSFAIASGGSPFYRNRIKTYLKEGLTQSEAETAAWSDFTKVSDETQQSGDPRDISKQQASGAGRLLLTFQNTAMQQSRIVKKSFLDLKNGRGDAKTHIAKITYYLAIQNIMFATLQQGLFAVLFSDDDKDEEGKKKKAKDTEKKMYDIADGVLDTILRGTGFTGGIIATLKNMYMKYTEEQPKDFKADYTKVVLEGANISPPIGSKLRKLYSGFQQTKFERDLIKERGWGVMQDGRVHLGPMYSVTGKGVEAITNVPMDRLVNKIENVSQAMNSKNTALQRVMVGIGFTPYSVGIEDTEGDQAIRAKAKEIRAEEGKIKAKETRERTKDSIMALPIEERMKLKREAALKRREEKLKRRKRKMG